MLWLNVIITSANDDCLLIFDSDGVGENGRVYILWITLVRIKRSECG